MKRISILGSTGSIGRQCLSVIDSMPGAFEVVALAAGSNVAVVAEQIARHGPRLVSVGTEDAAIRLRASLKARGGKTAPLPEILWGAEGIERVATHPEVQMVVSAAVGVVGLRATYHAIELGKDIALANKEVLVAAGEVVMAAVARRGVALLPVDSEHNAIHQCLRAGASSEVRRLILTASGGPFRETPISKMAKVTPKQALAHPNWKMGQRITIDSATLMNKGFEVIEACWLFGFGPSQVDVVIHPQSTVHAMIEYSDGSVLAQVSTTDMRMPIQYALTWPERQQAPVPKIDWSQPRQWDFAPPDFDRFPLLKLAYQCQETGGSATCTLNAADEIAVEAFLKGEISFPAIAAVVEETLSCMSIRQPRSVADILEIDKESRTVARAVAHRQKAAAQPVPARV